MEKDFVFIDDETDGKKRIFYRDIFYSYIKDLITDFLNCSLEYNEIHLRFISFLETLEDAGDVYFLMHEMPYHWALSIIQNTAEPDESIMINNHKLNKSEKDFYLNFLKKNSIESFIEEME
jgi:hypothetical protein